MFQVLVVHFGQTEKCGPLTNCRQRDAKILTMLGRIFGDGAMKLLRRISRKK
jgi:hypothetical protein